MKYSLDTNTCVRYINGRSSQILKKLPTIPASEIIVCSVVRAELFYGASRSQTPEVSLLKQERFLSPYATIPFDDSAARIYGRIRATLESKGQPIGAHDIMIAAIAIAHDLTVVTHNMKHFSWVQELRIEDWEAE